MILLNVLLGLSLFFGDGKTVNSPRVDSLKAVWHRTIEENDSSTIIQITSTDVSPNGKMLLIGDQSSSSVFLIDISTGHLIRHFEPYPGLSDSIALHEKSHLDTLRFMSIAEIDRWRDRDPKYTLVDNDVKRQFGASFFTSDTTIVILSQINAMMCKIGENNPPSWRGVGLGILTYKIDRQYPAFAWGRYEGNGKGTTWPQMYDATYDPLQKLCYVSVRKHEAFRQRHYDSTFTVGSYDFDGTYRGPICTVPEECKSFSLDYSCQRNVVSFTPSHEVLFAYGLVPRVYNLTKGTNFEVATPSDNKLFLKAIRESNVTPGRVKWDSILPLHNLTMWSLATSVAGNVIVTFSILDTGDGISWITHKYTEDGKLEQTYLLPLAPIATGTSSLFYSRQLDAVLGFSRTKNKGWDLTCYKL
jgi:hypothetical protein